MLEKERLKSYLISENPKVLTLCSSEDLNSDFSVSKKQTSLLADKLMKSKNNTVLSKNYQFPHKFPNHINTTQTKFVCFMGCNQLYHLFTSMFAVTEDEFLTQDELEEHVHSHIDVAHKNFPKAYFIFAERIKDKSSNHVTVQSVPFEYLSNKYNRPRPANISQASWDYRIFAIQVIIEILQQRFSRIDLETHTFYFVKEQAKMTEKLIPHSLLKKLQTISVQ